MESVECLNKVQATLKKIKGVISVEAGFKSNRTIVEIWKGSVSVNQLIKALEEIGYKATLLKTSLQTIILNVEGIDCQFCANTVKVILEKIKGVISAEVKFKEKKVIIKIWKNIASINQLINTIEDLGFEASVVKTI